MTAAYIPLSAGLGCRGVRVVWPMRCIPPAFASQARPNIIGQATNRNLRFIRSSFGCVKKLAREPDAVHPVETVATPARMQPRTLNLERAGLEPGAEDGINTYSQRKQLAY